MKFCVVLLGNEGSNSSNNLNAKTDRLLVKIKISVLLRYSIFTCNGNMF
jgi:hypothetical protein